LIRASDPEIMTWGRLLTPLFAILGAIAQWRLVKHLLKLRGALSSLSLVFALGLWFCASIARVWALTIHPDIPAAALVMIALCVIAWRPRFGFAYAGILFYLAWAFKESVVLAFIGVSLFLLLNRRWRDLSVLAATFAALVAVTLLLGTPEYRFNILIAPRLSQFSFRYGFPIACRVLIANAYWIVAPIALLYAAAARKLEENTRMLMTVLLVALAGGLVALGKEGAWYNYLLEAFAAGSTLLQFAVFSVPRRLVSALVLCGCVQPAILLASRPSGFGTHPFGTVELATPAEFADAVALRQRLQQLDKPIFSAYAGLAFPWILNDDHAPVVVLDKIFHAASRDRCRDGCIEGTLERGEIPTVVLGPADTVLLQSLNPGYKKVGEAVEWGTRLSIYAIHSKTPVPSPSASRITHCTDFLEEHVASRKSPAPPCW
jgi:hypothetical protein